MLSDLNKIVKRNKNDIILLIAVVLISLFSFAVGYITANYEEKEPIIIEYER